MKIRAFWFVCLFLLFAAVSGPAQQGDTYGVTLISDGAGSWGRGGFLYEGIINVKDTGFSLSITNVLRNIEPESEVSLVPQPFTATAMLSEDGTAVTISVQENGAKLELKALSNAYNLAYLLMANVFYEFFDEAWRKSGLVTDSSGQMVMNSRRAERIITQHFGTLPASAYSIGPVLADRFVVLPILNGNDGGITIGRLYREGVLTEVHLRQVTKGWQFPSQTRMLTVSRKESEPDIPINDIFEAALDKTYADSFNRVEIRLSR